jgi:hypothetical protein
MVAVHSANALPYTAVLGLDAVHVIEEAAPAGVVTATVQVAYLAAVPLVQAASAKICALCPGRTSELELAETVSEGPEVCPPVEDAAYVKVLVAVIGAVLMVADQDAVTV